jgi:hypothetical protein
MIYYTLVLLNLGALSIILYSELEHSVSGADSAPVLRCSVRIHFGPVEAVNQNY